MLFRSVSQSRYGEQTYKRDEVPIEPNRDGLVLIKRTEDEVFKPEAISSFEGKPFTIDHPDEMVTPENWKDLAHGFITNVRRGVKEKLDLLVGDIVVTTKKAIELIKNGMREISCGYDADYEQLDIGIGMQKNIIGNHIALVMRGRAGHRCAIGDKACTNCGKCNCKNITNDKEDEDAMRFKDKLKKAYRKLIKDEDFEKLPDDEKVDKLAEEASKQISEEAVEEEEKGKTKDEMSVDQIFQILVTLQKDVHDIQEFLMQILEIDSQIKEEVVGEGLETGDEGTIDPDKVLEKEEKEKEEIVDEDPEEKEKREKEEAVTCDSSFQDIAWRADILCPGIQLSKPTKDHMKVLDRIKRKAIHSAFMTDSDVVGGILKKEDVDKLDRTALGIAFVAASNAIKDRNNRFVKDSVVANTVESVSTIRGINERNKEFWKRK